MKKVGIVSCYFKNNYGSVLQAYATKKILDNNNIPNETINIDDNKDFSNGKKKYYMSQLLNFKFIKSKSGMIKLKFDKKVVKGLGKNINIRNKKYKEFRREFNLSKSCNSYKELSELARDKYSDIVLGSDQLWLPVNVVSDYYTLNWVPDDINKISYSTSFGISKIPEKYDDQYKKFLSRINHLSVREESGIKIIDNYGIKSKLVCDPTLLLTKEEWEEEAIKDRIIKEKYILCYYLGSNIEHRKFAKRLKDETGYKLVSLNHADEYVKFSDEVADIVPYDIGPREWINLIKYAEYICTDSFHGTVFSLIFNKMFFDFRRYKSTNNMSTNSRIDSLLSLAGVSNERILDGTEDVKEVLKYKMDFEQVNSNLDKIRNESKQWLLNSITYKEVIDDDKFIKIVDKELCSGCTACASSCPKKAIEMVRDDEGFLYPQVNKDECLNCGICKNVCPILNKKETKAFNQKGYIFQYKNNEVRKESTSGGAFTAIAEYAIQQKGVVYGVSFDNNFKVCHQRVDNLSGLQKFRNSKYVQSDPKNTFSEVLSDLKENKVVVYSGTACQIEGLKSFLKNDYDNLITVDVICRAVPSPLMWDKYLKYISKNRKVKKAFFREKYYGYKYSNLSLYDEEGNFYHNGIDTDPYLRAFFSNIACRPSCYKCNFKEQLHKADFTIWDCFEVEKYDEAFDDDLGTTRILINSDKGLKVFNKIKNNHKVKEVETDKLVSNFYQMFNSVKSNSLRKEFFNDLNNNDFGFIANKYFPNTAKCKLEKNMRRMLIKTGIYRPLIKIGRKVRKRD